MMKALLVVLWNLLALGASRSVPTDTVKTETTDITVLDVSKPKLLDRAWEAVYFIYPKQIEGDYLLIPIKVLTATKQNETVSSFGAGFLQKFDILVGESNCIKEPNPYSSMDKLNTGPMRNNCHLKEDGARFIFAASLFEQPEFKGCFKLYEINKVTTDASEVALRINDFNSTEVKFDSTSEPATSLRERRCSGPEPVDASTPEFLNRAWDAVQFIDHHEIEIANRLVPIKVLNATERHVAGTVYDFHILVGESTCVLEKNQSNDTVPTVPTLNTAPLRNDCKIKEGGARFIYAASMYEMPWIKGCYEEYNIGKERAVGADEVF